MEKITWTAGRRKLKDLKPWERNPRQITKEQARRLAESFDEFGQVETIAVSPTDDVYNGHQRLAVLMEKHGGDYEVEVRISSRALTEKEREKLTVYLHKGAAGEWNFDALANGFEVDDLIEWGFRPEELGLDKDYGIEKPEDAGAQIDKADELRQKWGVETGQLWKLGEHRLICGDCTDRAVVDRLMGGEKADITFTSPPYNAGKTPTESKLGTEGKYKDYSDDLTQDKYFELLDKFTLQAFDISDFVFVNIQMLAGNKSAFLRYLSQYADRLADIAIWNKQRAQPAMAQNVMNSQFEFVLVFGEVGASRKMPGNFRGTVPNVYCGKPQSGNDLGSDIHAATMPLDFAEWVVSNFSNASVYEPFSGSGTTIIACERLGRKCRAVEISPAYVAVSIQRWVDTTGGRPELIDQ